MRTGRTLSIVALVGALTSLPSPALAQADAVDDYVRSELLRQKIPGLALAIVRNGEVVRAKGYGLSNVELNVAATPATIFQSGSVGKQFTATLVMMLVEEGLGMSTARIISEADVVPNRAAGYHLVKGELKNHDWVAPALNTTADGSLYLTVLDMAKWDAALYTEKLLKKASLERMWTPVRLNDGATHTYGFGWSVGEVNGQRIIEHGGAWQGFKSYIARYVGKGLTVIIMANLAETDPGHIAHGVAATIDPALKGAER